jgi:hypothetical protein
MGHVIDAPAPSAAVTSDHGRSDDSPAWRRLEEQIAWYDDRSRRSQRWFKRLKVAQIVVAAAIPVGAGNSAPAWLIGGAGAFIVVLEGLQQLFQFQQNWTQYRSTCERLKHEKFLYLARAGSYARTARPDRQLAERVEGLVSQEHAAWTANREETTRHDQEKG